MVSFVLSLGNQRKEGPPVASAEDDGILPPASTLHNADLIGGRFDGNAELVGNVLRCWRRVGAWVDRAGVAGDQSYRPAVVVRVVAYGVHDVRRVRVSSGEVVPGGVDAAGFEVALRIPMDNDVV